MPVFFSIKIRIFASIVCFYLPKEKRSPVQVATFVPYYAGQVEGLVGGLEDLTVPQVGGGMRGRR